MKKKKKINEMPMSFWMRREEVEEMLSIFGGPRPFFFLRIHCFLSSKTNRETLVKEDIKVFLQISLFPIIFSLSFSVA